MRKDGGRVMGKKGGIERLERRDSRESFVAERKKKSTGQ